MASRPWASGSAWPWPSLSIRCSIGIGVPPADLPQLPIEPGVADLLLDDRKLGGILCEARWQGGRLGWIVIGIGLNVHNPLPQATPVAAARLADHGFSGELTGLGAAVAGLVSRVTLSTSPLTEAELAAFAARDWLTGRAILRPRAGTAIGIAPSGRLRVALAEGGVAELEDSTGLAVGP